MRVVQEILLFLLQLSGLYLFCAGYLLSRLELTTVSSLTSGPKHFNKTLLILIDALRFDFMNPTEIPKGEDIPNYVNKLPIIKEYLNNHGENCILFRGLADPPTTTLQRIMAIMTGALPTLVDAGSNFDSSALKEDNILKKIQARGEKVISIGDDTWDKLYPNQLDESYFYPSFDVWDLDTVDNGVKEHLFPILQEKKDWGLMVAHFLGVDHAGHRYGPGHWMMGEKLLEMNEILAKVFNLVTDDTLVIVMGDHGMDKKGDHGGDSFAEMDAGLFFFSKTKLYPKSNREFIDKIIKKTLEIEGYDIFSLMNNDRTVQQIDLVSTLSILMGLDIPFGNLGMVIPEFFLKNGLKDIIQTVRLNSQQVDTYLEAYLEKRPDAKMNFHKSKLLFKEAENLFESMEGYEDEEVVLEVYMSYLKFLRYTLMMARNIWSRFEPALMLMGLVVLLLGGLFRLLLVFNHLDFGCSLKDFKNVKTNTANIARLIIGSLGFGFIGYFTPIVHFMHPGEDIMTLTIKIHHEIIFFSAVGFLLTLTTFISKSSVIKLDISSTIESVLCVLYILSIGSDSFLIFEDFLLLHFIQFAHFAKLISLYFNHGQMSKNRAKMVAVVLMIILTRMISFVTICRPDQGPYCVSTFYSSPTSSIAAVYAPIFALGVGIVCCLMNFKSAKVPKLFSYVFTLSLFSAISYWGLDTFENHNLIPSTTTPKTIVLAVYWATVLIGISFVLPISNKIFHSRIKSKKSKNEMMNRTIFMALLMFQKPMAQVVLLLAYIYIQIDQEFSLNSDLFLFGQLLFFTTGHQNILASVQYDVGFVGLSNANFIISPIYVFLNIVAGQICCMMWGKEGKWKWDWTLEVSVGFCMWFSRHSQAFRVWGPKFLFIAVGFIGVFFVDLLVGDEHNEKETNKID